jgi:hypothetical protein
MKGCRPQRVTASPPSTNYRNRLNTEVTVMLIFSNPETAARAGFKIVDYDLIHQTFIVAKGKQRLSIRAVSNSYAAILPTES